MKWTFQTDLYPIGIIATEMFIPRTRDFVHKDIRDIQIISKEWYAISDNAKIVFKRIISNLLNEIRALRFNDIDELINEIRRVKEVIK